MWDLHLILHFSQRLIEIDLPASCSIQPLNELSPVPAFSAYVLSGLQGQTLFISTCQDMVCAVEIYSSLVKQQVVSQNFDSSAKFNFISGFWPAKDWCSVWCKSYYKQIVTWYWSTLKYDAQQWYLWIWKRFFCKMESWTFSLLVGIEWFLLKHIQWRWDCQVEGTMAERCVVFFSDPRILFYLLPDFTCFLFKQGVCQEALCFCLCLLRIFLCLEQNLSS